MIRNGIKKVLIINLGGIGDILLSVPAIKALKKAYPEAAVSFLLNNRGEEIAKRLLDSNGIFTFYIGYGGKLPFSKIFQNLGVLLALRGRRFDMALNMRTIVSKQSALKLKVLLDIINPRLKTGRDTDGMGYFFDIKIPETLIGKKYEMEYDIDAVKALGAEVSDRTVNLEINDGITERVNNILEKNGICKDDLLVGLNPGGKPSSRWPIDYFSKAIDKISEEAACKFAVTGLAGESGLARKLSGITKTKIADLTGKLDIDELFAFIKRCDLFISNDTSTMHIAAVLKTRLIAIFGPGDITRFDPRNISDKATVLFKKADCSPCSLIVCDPLKCLRAISPEELADAALKLLKDHKYR